MASVKPRPTKPRDLRYADPSNAGPKNTVQEPLQYGMHAALQRDAQHVAL
jgi:hypothetical protein